ncbi:MAG: 16S rRNA (cytidine(1402)-2'-O)-methyltransferase [Acidimicrobiia bacterium]|nr:16S rRNA (cytidine(1402)-2'-O)-methyltransferase [Acidimicrobiia bacterium]
MSGVLVLVATPIGNLADLSPRAVDELGAADVVACEDTRRTGRLLSHAGVAARRLVTVNDHTEAGRIPELLDHLSRGERVAVVTDAGTPGISDPGERLVRAAVRGGHAVEVVPGPSAFVAALVASGLPTGRFVFEGFLPRKGSSRAGRLDELAAERRTIVLYEAPHRLERTLADLAAALGPDRRVRDRPRGSAKLHEEVWHGRLGEAVTWVGGAPPRRDRVLVVDGAPPPRDATDDEVRDALGAALERGESRRDAAASVAAALGVPKRRAYDLVTGL